MWASKQVVCAAVDGLLADDVIAVPVRHEAGQKVAFAVAEAVERRMKHAFAQGEGIGQSAAQEIRAENFLGFAADHAHGDE